MAPNSLSSSFLRSTAAEATASKHRQSTSLSARWPFGNSNTVGVPRQIGQELLGTGEGLFRVDDPFGCAQRRESGGKCLRLVGHDRFSGRERNQLGISYNAAVVQGLDIGGLMPKAASSANIRPPTSAAFISVYPFLHFGDFIKEPAHTKYGQRCTRPLSVLQIFRSVGDAPVAG